jgi:universal stress protein E
MAGTIVCGVIDSPGGSAALQLAGALSQRLRLRLVLAHAVDGLPPGGSESLTGRQRRSGAERALARLVREMRLPDLTERRIEHGEGAELLALVAAEEGADLIVIGSSTRGFRGRQLRCALARELEAMTSVPVLIAPPQTRNRSEQRLAVAEVSAAR